MLVFDADQPIVTEEQDCLGRAPFAKHLARCLLDYNSVASLVVGLQGGLGTGKTSIINLAIAELTVAASNLLDEQKPIVVSLDAWQVAEQAELIPYFLRCLSFALYRAPGLANRDQLCQLLERYAVCFANLPVLYMPRHQQQSLLAELLAGRTVHHGGRDENIGQIKTAINEALALLPRKLIIVIDQLTRLAAPQMRRILQIMQTVANLANTVYLVAFDKTLLLSLLQQEYDLHYSEMFINKVIQLSFKVPPISAQAMEILLCNRLRAILSLVPEGAWNTRDWLTLYHVALKYFFKQYRDVTHYVNTLGFAYPRLREVVNPVDFFALTVIEVFLPEIYQGICSNKDLFTDLLTTVYPLDDHALSQDQLRCEEIIQRSQTVHPDIDPDRIRDLLQCLFPRIRYLYYPKMMLSQYNEQLAQRDKRLCAPEVFAAYFRLTVQEIQLADSEIKTLLRVAQDSALFSQLLTRLNQDERIIPFLSLLDTATILDQIPTQHIFAIVHGLLDNGDFFPNQVEEDPLFIATPLRIQRIIHSLLTRIHLKQREQILRRAIGQLSKSLYIAIRVLLEEEYISSHEESLAVYRPLMTAQQLNKLHMQMIAHIEQWAMSDRLAEHPHFEKILAYWLRFSPEDMRIWLAKLVTTDRGLLAFLVAMLREPIKLAMTEYVKNPAWQEQVQAVGTFISPVDLVAHARSLFEDVYFEKLRETEQLALLIFLDEMQVKTNKIITKTSD